MGHIFIIQCPQEAQKGHPYSQCYLTSKQVQSSSSSLQASLQALLQALLQTATFTASIRTLSSEQLKPMRTGIESNVFFLLR